MKIRLNRLGAGLLLLLLAPVILPARLFRWMAGRDKKPVYPSTVEGDPLAYAGPRPLVVSLWAPWASIWKIATEQIVRDLQAEFSGRCEFAYVEVTDSSIEQKYGVQVAPAVLVFHSGHEIGRFINLLEATELRRCISRVAEASEETPTAARP